MKLQRLFTISEAGALFGNRTVHWVRERIKAGDFGEVLRDRGGWLIPEAGLQKYMDQHRISPKELAQTTEDNPQKTVVPFPG